MYVYTLHIHVHVHTCTCMYIKPEKRQRKEEKIMISKEKEGQTYQPEYPLIRVTHTHSNTHPAHTQTHIMNPCMLAHYLSGRHRHTVSDITLSLPHTASFISAALLPGSPHTLHNTITIQLIATLRVKLYVQWLLS